MPKAEEFDFSPEAAISTGATATTAATVAEDPFATDFFTHKSAENSVKSQIGTDFAYASDTENLAPWQIALPRVRTSEAQISRSLARLPLQFSEKILQIAEQTVSSCVLNDAASALCEIVGISENDFTGEIDLLVAEQAVFLTFAVEPDRALAAFAIDAAFAAQMVETAFSGEQQSAEEEEEENRNVSVSERHVLSPTELTVLEFFAANFFNSLNKYLGEPLFRQIGAEQTAPAWFAQEAKSKIETENLNLDLGLPQTAETARLPKRGLMLKIKLRLGEQQQSAGIVNLLLPFGFLESLSGVENPLLLRHDADKKRDRLKKILAETSLRVLLGETTVPADDLAFLEAGDIVLIEKAAISRDNSDLSGKTLVKIAAETLGSLYGKLATNESGRLYFDAREIRQNPIGGDAARLKMDEQLTTENGAVAEAAGALALEKIIVTMTVELVSRRISLDELAGLRAGQIVDLGCRATDPVELVADGKTVAIGELVDVEGSLGVRVLRILI